MNSVDSKNAPREVRVEGPPGTGRVLRSETVGVRLDRRLRYLAELAARDQRRTLSSFIEWCIEEALSNIDIASFDAASEKVDWKSLWDVKDADRFVKLCRRNPDLLTYEEQVRWKAIQECGFFWKGQWVGEDLEWTWNPAADEPDIAHLRSYWRTVCEVSAGSTSKDELPRWALFFPTEATDLYPFKQWRRTAILAEDVRDDDIARKHGKAGEFGSPGRKAKNA